MTDKPAYDYFFKMLLIGDSGSGKVSSLISPHFSTLINFSV